MVLPSRTLRALLALAAITSGAAASAPAGAAAELPQSGRLWADTAGAGPDGHVAIVAGGRPGGPVAVRLADPADSAFARTLPLPDDAGSATVAVGPGGAMAALWSAGEYGHGTLVLAYRAPGAAAFGPPEPVSDDPPLGEQWPAMAFDAVGTLTVAWAPGRHDDQMLVRTRAAAGGAWSAPQVLRARRADRPRLAVTPNGSAALAWSDDERRVAVATRAPGAAAFGPSRVLSGRDRAAEPAVAANDRGDVAVAWDQDATGEGDFSIAGGFRAAGSPAFEPARRLSRAGTEAAFPSVSVAPDGRTVYAYGRDSLDGQARVEARIRTRSGRLMRPVVLDRSAQDGDNAALALGCGLVAWFHRDRPHHRSSLRTATARADGLSFDPPRTRYVVPARAGFGDDPTVFAVPGGLVTLGPGTTLTRSPG